MQAEIEEKLKIARGYITNGKLPNAIRIANDIIKKYRNNPKGWLLLSEINVASGNLSYALENAQKSVQQDTAWPPSLAQLARCYVLAGQKKLAGDMAKKAVSCNPEQAETLNTLSAILTHCDEQHMALSLSEKAVQQQPDNPWYRYNLATIQRMLGMLEEAEANCDKAIQQNPDDFRAYHVRSDLRTQTADNNHIQQLEKRLAAGVRQWRGEMMLNFALAKEKEDIEDFDGSFRHLKQACDLQRSHLKYDVEDDIRTIEKIISTHTSDALSGTMQGCTNREPIFIVGLPRTGTTLVERIVSSHSEVLAAGELQNFATELVKAVQGSAGKQTINKADLVEMSLRVDFRSLGQAYVESTRPVTGHTSHFIDKLPMNYLYCGLIHAALPGARIIALERNPMDSCYAMYKTPFEGAYPFSYDLNELGRYYIVWRQLMNHWQMLLGEKLFTVNYEKLVGQTEKVSRELIDFCGLEWQDACLEFYQSDAPSSTASASQIRQPVYDSSVNKWLNYRKQLQPLVAFFEKHGIVTT